MPRRPSDRLLPETTEPDATETATPASDLIDGTSAHLSPMVDEEATPDWFAGLPIKSRDRYRIGKEIARGGIGKILEAYDTELGRTVAIKELLSTEGRGRARFFREATITARLEHPSIVPIQEAGRWPEGEPFYVMKLVSGRSLKALVNEAHTRKARLALLPQILAVADALAYAHSEHIIHRDLKPSNVLVGTYGETVVIDWGLAKDLRATQEADDPADEHDVDAAESGSDDPALTVAGTVLGTPAYMSPEQARGEAVDMRTDVYAIGAILYHALSGSAPYRGSNSHEIVEQVCGKPPIAIEQRVPDLPADLVTIVTRAIARDSNMRYRDAGELASDLRRFQEGQLVGAHLYSTWQLVRRWLGRRRLAVLVAAVMTTVLVVGGVVSVSRITTARDRAEAERQLSEENRVEVEELMGFMLVDLRDRLQPLGKLELLDMVAGKASAYFEQRPLDWSRPDEALSRGMARANLGDVRYARGELDQAQTEYAAAMAIFERLVELDAANTTWQRALSQGHNRLGDVWLLRGKFEQSLTEHRAALVIAKRLLKLDPDNDRRVFDLSVSHSRLGSPLQRRGDLAGAIKAHGAARQLLERLVKTDSGRDDWQHALATSHMRVGALIREQGDTTAALAHFRSARSVRTRLARIDPTNATWQNELAGVHDQIGRTHLAREELVEAFAELKIAVEIRTRIVQRDPANTVWQRGLAAVHASLGDVLLHRGDMDGALVQFDASMTIRARLAASDPANIEWQSNLALGHAALGDVFLYREDRQPALAQAQYREALTIRERMLAQDPDNTRLLRAVALIHLSIAGTLKGQGDDKRMHGHLTLAANLYEKSAVTSDDFYNTACAFALADDSDGAFKMLDKSVARGFRKGAWAAKDTDLSSLRTDPRWQPLLQRMTP